MNLFKVTIATDEVVAAATSLERIDVRLIEAATDLYSSAFTAFRKVTP